MNYERIKSETKCSDLFISYLRKLSSEQWFKSQTDEKIISIYSKAIAIGLPIDGDMVTIVPRSGECTLSFDYHAYKNLVLSKYPETKFDHQIVCEGDNFSFRKDSGSVIYSHTIGDPFNPSRAVIGAYAVVKNKTGEFIEFVNMEDINKMRASSRSKNIWEQWFDRMVLKSVIKRICSVNFKDIVAAVERIDNENYDLSAPSSSFDQTAFEQLNNAQTFVELKAIWKANSALVSNQNAFNEQTARIRKERFEIAQGNERFEVIANKLATDEITLPEVERDYYLTPANRLALIDHAASN